MPPLGAKSIVWPAEIGPSTVSVMPPAIVTTGASPVRLDTSISPMPMLGSAATSAGVSVSTCCSLSETDTVSPGGAVIGIDTSSNAKACSTSSATEASVAVTPLTPIAGSPAIWYLLMFSMSAAVSLIVTASPDGAVTAMPACSSATACATVS